MMKTIPAACCLLVTFAAVAAARPPRLEMCNQRPNTPTKTCLVDGDTLWLHGQDIRLKDFDTPEPQTNICGGAAEVALAHRASARLLELLNGFDWTSSISAMTAPAASGVSPP